MFTILEQGIQAALAAGQAIPPALVNMKDEKFRSIDKEMYRLSNDLDRIADMLFNEFSGVGNTGAADRISDYALRYREATHTYVSPRDDAKPFLSQDKPLKVNLSGICEVINRINAAREARQASTERMKAGANAMVWEGEDATLARIQWNLMSGPGSNHQIITDGMLQFTQAAAAPILSPEEKKRLDRIAHLEPDRLRATGKDLVRAANAFEEAEKKANRDIRIAMQYISWIMA